MPYFFLFATNLVASYAAHVCVGNGAWMNLQTYQDCTALAAMLGLWSALVFPRGNHKECVPKIVQVCCIIVAAWLHVSMLLISFYLSWLVAEAFHEAHDAHSGWFTLRVVRSVFVKVVLAEFLHVIFEKLLDATRSLPPRKTAFSHGRSQSSGAIGTHLLARSSPPQSPQHGHSQSSGAISTHLLARSSVPQLPQSPQHGHSQSYGAIDTATSSGPQSPQSDPGPRTGSNLRQLASHRVHSCAVIVTTVVGFLPVLGVFFVLFFTLHA